MNRVVLWEIATRRRPWKSVPFEVIQDSVLQGYRPPILIDDQWNPEFRRLVELCWNQDPLKRPSFSKIARMFKKMTVPVVKDE